MSLRILIIPVLFLSFTKIFSQEKISVGEIREKFESFEYENVINLSRQLLMSKKELSDEDMVDLYLMKGVSHYALGDEESASASYFEILRLDENFEPDPVKISPKIITFFDKVKRQYRQIISIKKETIPEKKDSSASLQKDLIKLKGDLLRNSIARSLILPGWGHLYLNDNTKGWILTGAGTAVLGTMLYFIFDTNAKENDYLNETNRNLMNSKFEDYNSAFKIRNALILSYIVLWLYSQIDILFASDELIFNNITTRLSTDIRESSMTGIELSLLIRF